MLCDMCNALHQRYRVVGESEHCFSVVNAYPLKDGHLMVLPRRHVLEMSELSEAESKNMFGMIGRIYSVLERKYNEGVIVFKNGTGHFSQEHLHFHILPSKGGLRQLVSSYEGVPMRERASEERLERMRDYILG